MRGTERERERGGERERGVRGTDRQTETEVRGTERERGEGN